MIHQGMIMKIVALDRAITQTNKQTSKQVCMYNCDSEWWIVHGSIIWRRGILWTELSTFIPVSGGTGTGRCGGCCDWHREAMTDRRGDCCAGTMNMVSVWGNARTVVSELFACVLRTPVFCSWARDSTQWAALGVQRKYEWENESNDTDSPSSISWRHTHTRKCTHW